jgi:hypothetical protein
MNIQHGLEVLQRFKATHEPLVKALSRFDNMESHGKPIKPVLHQLITWTPPKEGITLLEFFGNIGISLETLLQLGMVVRRYFYVDIDPIARQVVASRMIELTSIFPQQFATTAWKANFTFLASDIQLIQKKHMELFGPMDLIISGWDILLNLTRGRKSRSTTRWSSITLKSCSYSMRHNAIIMCTGCETNGPTLHHSQFYN